MQNNTVSYNSQEIKYVTIYKNNITKKYPLNDCEIVYNVNYAIDDDLMIRMPPLSDLIIDGGNKKTKLKNNSANHKSFGKDELYILLDDIKNIYSIKIVDLEKIPNLENGLPEYGVEHFDEGHNMYYYVKSNFTLTNIILFVTFVLIIYFIILEKFKKKLRK